LLLAIAVILPTVCLVWFMNQAVKNERLAVRQKLTDVYQQELDALNRNLTALWTQRLEFITARLAEAPAPDEIFDALVGRPNDIDTRGFCDGVVVFDSNGVLLYPLVDQGAPLGILSESFEDARRIEFAENRYEEAAARYGRAADAAYDEYTRYYALLAQVRCLGKMKAYTRAMALCRDIAYGPYEAVLPRSAVALRAKARLLLIDLKSESPEGLQPGDVKELADSLILHGSGADPMPVSMPSETREFLLRQTLDLISTHRWTSVLPLEVKRIEELLQAETFSAAIVRRYYSQAVSGSAPENRARELINVLRSALNNIPLTEGTWSEQVKSQIVTLLDTPLEDRADQAAPRPASLALFDTWGTHVFRRMDLPEPAFGIYHTGPDRIILCVQTTQTVTADFGLCGDDLMKLDMACRVTDYTGRRVLGAEAAQDAPFLKGYLGPFFPGWTIELHYEGSDIFERTAAKQGVVYLWTGLLAIAAMLVAGALVAQVVGRQMKINRLKNDFIATVTHELKTPLSSMRLLVDTLLNNRCEDQQQVTDYLQLISKENERLSRLIEDFLTFSRMERNKQVFTMKAADPTEIAREAVEVVQTKFAHEQCGFSLMCEPDLPRVWADKNAMVTVLANLLDNACKYSGDQKQITLHIYAEADKLCFAVQDHGIGMTSRQVKKIFTKFYQADSTLSRQTEGCGLGLSIVKYIVDAHRGSIEVQSKPDRGSTFTVKLYARRS